MRPSGPDLADVKVGDCLKLAGTPDRPQATKATCGSPESNFKVVALVKGGDRAKCPTDVDSSYSTHNALSGSDSTLCLDVDWVIGGCMSVDPHHTVDPVRVDCGDSAAPHRQRATEILTDLDPRSGSTSAAAVWATPTRSGGSPCVSKMSTPDPGPDPRPRGLLNPPRRPV